MIFVNIKEKIKLDNTLNAPVKTMTDKQLEEYLQRVRGIIIDMKRKTG